MKIAIQGHLTRGKEVIKILESLGGKTAFTVYGFDESYCYYINPNGIIIESLISIKTKDEFKLYTLEEFDKEFPFKVGDIVTFKENDKYPHIIKSLGIWTDGDIVCEFEDTRRHYSLNKLKYYKEMKEERNITLTLDKAREWYNKGGDLKQIALQAFTEEELNPLPRSWKEFCKKYPKIEQEAYIDIRSTVYVFTDTKRDRNSDTDRDICPSKQSAEAHLAMIQLEQLRDCWRRGWKPTKHNAGYQIIHYPGEYLIKPFHFIGFLSFPTMKMAEEFLECFRDLIEKAGDLI